MRAAGVDKRTTGASVWLAEVYAEAEANCYTDSFIIQPQPAAGYGHGV